MNRKNVTIIITTVIVAIGLITVFLFQTKPDVIPGNKNIKDGFTVVCASGNTVESYSQCNRILNKETGMIPDKFQSVILEENNSNYVKNKGEVKILFSESGSISISIEKANSPNKELNQDKDLPFIYYFDETSPTDSFNQLVYGKYGAHYFKFNAPEIPGTYKVILSEPFEKTYTLTVINVVNNELLVYKIADRFIFSNLDEANIQNWNTTSNEIESLETNWKIKLDIKYKSCGIDWDSDTCIDKSVTGSYLIDKKTGIIVGDGVL